MQEKKRITEKCIIKDFGYTKDIIVSILSIIFCILVITVFVILGDPFVLYEMVMGIAISMIGIGYSIYSIIQDIKKIINIHKGKYIKDEIIIVSQTRLDKRNAINDNDTVIELKGSNKRIFINHSQMNDIKLKEPCYIVKTPDEEEKILLYSSNDYRL